MFRYTAEALQAKYVEIGLVEERWANLKLNIRLNGYVYRQHLYTVRYIGKWFYYNFAAGSFQDFSHKETL